MKMTIRRYFLILISVLAFLIMYLICNWLSFLPAGRSVNLVKEYSELFGQRHSERSRLLTSFDPVKSRTALMTKQMTTTTVSSMQRHDEHKNERLLKDKATAGKPNEPAANIPKPASSRTDAVIVLTMMRSGSSIIGSLFNERSNVTYLYEPLYPFGERPCDVLPDDRVQVLRHISRCEFGKLPALYRKAFNRSKRPDLHSRCKIHNVYFTSKSEKVSHFLSRDAGFCSVTKQHEQICPEPLDSEALNKHCKQSLLVAMKVIYLCKLQWLVPLLEDPDYNIKVVHLVRDPRATLNSRGGALPKKTVDWARRGANLICEQLIPNVNFADDILCKSNVRDKYFRVRYEDFASDPMGISEKIYNFVGINMNTHIRQWLESATSQSNNPNLRSRAEQGLKRNPTSSLLAWRKELSWEVVQAVQERCSEALQKLGYKNFKNINELKNLSQSYQT